MPAVLVTGPTATQNSPFLPQQWLRPVFVAHTGIQMASLSGLSKYGDGRTTGVVTNPSTNQARRSLTFCWCDQLC